MNKYLWQISTLYVQEKTISIKISKYDETHVILELDRKWFDTVINMTCFWTGKYW